MNCKKVKRKLSAYLDNELKEKEQSLISEHLKTCENCKKELNIFLEQNKFLMKLETIKPSIDFKPNFWRKVRAIENPVIEKMPVLKWIPVPVFCSIGIILFLGFLTLSPLLYGISNTEMSKKIFYHIKKSFIPLSQQSIFAPINFSNFCDEYCKTLCEECQIKTNTKKCICGRCGDGKI